MGCLHANGLPAHQLPARRLRRYGWHEGGIVGPGVLDDDPDNPTVPELGKWTAAERLAQLQVQQYIGIRKGVNLW
jgi:hypothetical protein